LKINITGKQTITVLFCLIILGVYGCGQRSKPATFYLLSPLSETETKAAGKQKAYEPVKIAVGPVQLAPYLKRKQLLVRSGEHKLIIKEFSRWGEPLQDNLQRVLVENLSLLLSTPHIYEYDHCFGKGDFQVIVDVNRFDVSDSGQAVLSAFWSINDSKSKRLLRKKTVINLEITNLDSNNIVNTLNKMLTDFSIEITEEIRSLQ
jgi:hypothetical protein